MVVKTMHFHCEDHVAAMAAATEEIKKLTLWYENYIRAHDELPSEIRRRIDFEKKQQEVNTHYCLILREQSLTCIFS